MKWEDYLKENSEKSIEGNKIWITDVRLSDGNAYIRNVPPTEVIIVSNSKLPNGKRVYYSDYHFLKLNKKGEPLKQIVAPFDNTGYRSYTGVSVNVFYSYADAVKKYNEQLDEIINQYESKKKEIDRHIKNTLDSKIK